jgi:hypothetical protein
MPNVFIIHGAYGTPEENWFPWLKRELEKIGCTVYVPAFPTPEGQSLSAWLAVFKQYEKYVRGDSIFVGHSIGATFILDLLMHMQKKVRAIFLVSCFVTPAIDPNNEVTEINKTFYEKPFDWETIKALCGDAYVIGSDNDPYVTVEMVRGVSQQLGGAPLIVIKGAGHFNEKAGYTEFPQLLGMIKSSISEG